jgi:hypothetical protein
MVWLLQLRNATENLFNSKQDTLVFLMHCFFPSRIESEGAPLGSSATLDLRERSPVLS